MKETVAIGTHAFGRKTKRGNVLTLLCLLSILMGPSTNTLARPVTRRVIMAFENVNVDTKFNGV
jgi:hypothetical protein